LEEEDEQESMADLETKIAAVKGKGVKGRGGGLINAPRAAVVSSAILVNTAITCCPSLLESAGPKVRAALGVKLGAALRANDLGALLWRLGVLQDTAAAAAAAAAAGGGSSSSSHGSNLSALLGTTLPTFSSAQLRDGLKKAKV
jgi:hypothetical protein